MIVDRWTNSRASSCDSTLAGEGNGAVRLYIYIYISLSLLYIYIYLCASTSISHSLSTSLYLTVDTERCIYVHCGSATHMANRHCAYGSAARCPRLAHYTLQAFVRPSPTASPIRDRPSGRGRSATFSPLSLSLSLALSLSPSLSLALSLFLSRALSLSLIYTGRDIYIYIFFSLSPSADLYAKLSFVPLLAPLRDAPPDHNSPTERPLAPPFSHSSPGAIWRLRTPRPPNLHSPVLDGHMPSRAH